jgi:cyanophycinase-like exopeptidase
MVGRLFAIGGAEAKLRRRTVLGAFVTAAGGTDARIAVVSSASSLGAEIVEARAAETDLREVARDIAAEGLPPSGHDGVGDGIVVANPR